MRDLKIFNDGVGEQFFASVPERALTASTSSAFDFHVENFALANARHALDSERLQRALDSFALRIQNPGFRVTTTRAFIDRPFRSVHAAALDVGAAVRTE